MGDAPEAGEQRRLEALARYRVLDTPAEPVFDDLTALAAEITGTPTALISFVDADRQWFKSVLGFPFAQSTREVSFCSVAIREEGVLTVEDATADPRFADNPLVTGGPEIRFYAGAPLVTPDGHALGTICGIDYRPRTLSPAQERGLQRLAAQVVRELEVRRGLADLAATVTGHGRPEEAHMLQAVLEGAPAVVSVKDTSGRYLMVNAQFLAACGRTRAQVLGRTDAQLFGETWAAPQRRDDLRALTADEPLRLEQRVEDGAGTRHLTSVRFPLRDWRGLPYATCSIALDVTDRVLAEEASRRSSAYAAQLVASALDGIVASDADGTITEFNPAAERMYGWSREEVLGRNGMDLFIPPASREVQRAAFQAQARGEPTELVGRRMEVLGQRRDGEVFPLELTLVDLGADPGRFVSFARDISERRHAEDRLRELAEHDPHTGLANRATFFRALAVVADGASATTVHGSVLLVDLDSFKHVNDTLGHRAGDVCLRHVAEVLRQRVRDGDLGARLGGDEFAVLLPGVAPLAARGVAEALLELLRLRTVTVDGRAVRLTASIGVAPVTGGGTPEELLHRADAAMYQAKQSGRDRVAVYDEVAAAAQADALHAGQAHRLRHALAEGRFTLEAQPIVELSTGATHCFELLVRMREPTGELVLPGGFLPAAERFDLVQKIDAWVVAEAVSLLRRCAEAGLPRPRLHVNLSGRSLSDAPLLRTIEEQIAAVDPGCLVFEVTETAAVTHLDTAVAFTRRLAELGCDLALDDFGAGYASFFYLKHLPVQTVKIDGDFVRGMLTERLDRAVVRATVGLAQDMGYRTVAEHVESAEVLEELRHLGVDHVQGFHVGRPEPAEVALGLRAGAPQRA